MIKKFEGVRLVAYQDTGGVWTLGFGTTFYPDGSRVKEGDTCTLEQAETWMINDITLSRLPNIKRLVKIPLTDNQVCALVSFCYNLGNTGFARSTLLTAINEGGDVRAEFMRYVHDDGKVLAGLERRRKAEAELFFA